jgi:uncharacterized protein YndB with AHSA1/START domain
VSEPIVVERTYAVSPETVWRALTEPGRIKAWSFDMQGFHAVPGVEFRFEGGPPGKVYVHVCRVTIVEPGRRLVYTWRYEGYAGESTVEWALEPADGGTRLRLTHTGVGSFPREVKDFDRENFVAGWNAILGEGLAAYLRDA